MAGSVGEFSCSVIWLLSDLTRADAPMRLYVYTMRAMMVSLLSERIAGASLAVRQGLAVEVLASTPSTNAELRARVANLQSPLLLVTDIQTAGRGRAGRSWRSAPGDSLCFSLAWRFQGTLARLSGLSLAVGVAVAEALRAQGWPVQLKWPNDLLLEGAKLGGILIETAARASDDGVWAVIGVGLNVHANAERDAVLGDAVTALSEVARENVAGAAHNEIDHIDRNLLLASIADTLSVAMHAFDQHGLQPFVPRWHGLHEHQNCAVMLIENGQLLHEGVARGIDDQGCLLLDTAAGRVAITAGDVSLRRGQNSNHSGALHAAAD